jgi:hypothetical protein
MAHCWTDRNHTITNLICCAGRHDKDWSADYRLYSRDLDQQALFKPIVQRSAKLTASSAPIILCVDDSQMKKTGRQIKEAGYYRDPLGPKFHTNLIYALRFVQMSIAVPDESYVRTHRTIPVAASVIVKLPKDASEASRTENSPSMHALNLLRQVRENMDEQDQGRKILLCSDSHYTTSTLLQRLPKNVTYIGRFRKDASLFVPAETQEKKRGRPKSYGEPLPTPDELRKDKSVPWKEASIKRNGRTMTIRYKRIQHAKWEPAGEKHTVQVVVVAPLRRKRYASGQWSYTDPAFLICTDPDLAIEDLLQAYTIRWGIEVNFREEKQLFGIGHAQVRQSRRVLSAPVVAIAACAALLLAGRETFHDGHRPSHLRSGRWQRRWKHRSYRTSDLRQQLHHEAISEQIDSSSVESPCSPPIKPTSALPSITQQKP